MSNMVDTELQTRAGILHDNAAALARQEKDVEAATAGLRVRRRMAELLAPGPDPGQPPHRQPSPRAEKPSARPLRSVKVSSQTRTM